MSRPGGANLVNLERVTKSYGVRILLDEVSLGVGEGERIGIVGRNGDGKTTLLDLLSGRTEPDSGRISRTRGLHVGHLDQRDLLDPAAGLIPTPAATVGEVVLGGRAEHEWAADPVTREFVGALLAGVDTGRPVQGLSGGERRRCALGRVLLEDREAAADRAQRLLVLDEPTNHLDVEAVAWLADHLAARRGALVVVTHDRWFLDAVCETTWEVHPGADGAGVVDAYDGGYAAFVLAKAERQRQAAASESRRQNLVRKELAWLRRGAPARTSKPKFRIEAATALIADEPPPRDRLALERFATQRLGKDVLDLEDVDLARGDRQLLRHATWRLGPGDRVGIVGVNGAGKTTVLNLLAGELAPDSGRVRRGRTVSLAHLTQSVDWVAPGTDVDGVALPGRSGRAEGDGVALPGRSGRAEGDGVTLPGRSGRAEGDDARVLATIEDVRRVARTAGGRDVTATSLLERFGFTGDRLTARIGDLSGGERRRFQLLRLLLGEPNVLLLDEPTNDLDIETLRVLEDFLDSWPGTLVVVSHDRYFLERVTDSTWALLGDGRLSMLPGGVDDYLSRLHQTRRDGSDSPPELAEAAQTDAGEASRRRGPTTPQAGPAPARSGGAEERRARKTLARLDRQLAQLAEQEAALHDEAAAHATDHVRLAGVGLRLAELAAERDRLEQAWLETAELLQ